MFDPFNDFVQSSLRQDRNQIRDTPNKHLSCQRHSPFVQIDQRQHGKCTIRVPHQTTVAYLGKTIEALERSEWMFDLGSHLRLAAIGFLVGIRQWRATSGAFIGEVFCFWRNLIKYFILADVGTITIQSGFVAM